MGATAPKSHRAFGHQDEAPKNKGSAMRMPTTDPMTLRIATDTRIAQDALSLDARPRRQPRAESRVRRDVVTPTTAWALARASAGPSGLNEPDGLRFFPTGVSAT